MTQASSQLPPTIVKQSELTLLKGSESSTTTRPNKLLTCPIGARMTSRHMSYDLSGLGIVNTKRVFFCFCFFFFLKRPKYCFYL